MHTFAELHSKLNDAKSKRAVLTHLTDILERDFLPTSPEAPPKHMLLNEDKVAVPQSAVNLVIDDLLKEIEELDKVVEGIMQSTLESNLNESTEKASE